MEGGDIGGGITGGGELQGGGGELVVGGLGRFGQDLSEFGAGRFGEKLECSGAGFATDLFISDEPSEGAGIEFVV